MKSFPLAKMFWAKLIRFGRNLVRFGQNKNLASPKALDLRRL